MTTWYECDRCRERTRDESDLQSVTVDQPMGGYKPMVMTYHFCAKCSVYFSNALGRVIDGSYDGRVKE